MAQRKYIAEKDDAQRIIAIEYEGDTLLRCMTQIQYPHNTQDNLDQWNWQQDPITTKLQEQILPFIQSRYPRLYRDIDPYRKDWPYPYPTER